MSLSIKLVLRKDFLKQDGTAQLLIQVIRKGEIKKIPTEYYFKPEHWDPVSQKITKKHPSSLRANNAISNKLREITDRIFELEASQKEYSLDEISPTDRIKKSKETLQVLITNYIEDCRKGLIIKPDTGKAIKRFPQYNSLLLHLKSFNPSIDYVDINEEFYSKFVYYLRHEIVLNPKTGQKGLAENTIGKDIKNLKKFMHIAVKRGYCKNVAFEDFHVIKQDADTIYLTESEIDKIMAADLPEHLTAERDRFFVAYNLFARFEDSIHINEANIYIENERHFCKYKHGKTKKDVIVPLFAKSVEILKKHNYKFPKTTNQEANWKLKEIGRIAEVNSLVEVKEHRAGKDNSEMVPKYTQITTHTCRRSMATNMYLATGDLYTIRDLGGWKTIVMLERYLKIDKLQSAQTAVQMDYFHRW